MVLFNHATREMTAKIVYYGPGLCGKTTNLLVIFDKLDAKTRGKMLSLATKTDRTLFFDLLPVDVGKVGTFNLRIQLYTVPGQVFYNQTRKLVLKGADAIVFVVDSQPSMLDSNRESFSNLLENLEENQLDPNDMPMVVQYNKRDLPGVLPVEELEQKLGFDGFPFVEASALRGDGVMDTFKLVSKLTAKHLVNKVKGKPRRPSRGRILEQTPAASPGSETETDEVATPAQDDGAEQGEFAVGSAADAGPFGDAAVNADYERVEEVNLEELLEGRPRPATFAGDIAVPIEDGDTGDDDEIEPLAAEEILPEADDSEVSVEAFPVDATPTEPSTAHDDALAPDLSGGISDSPFLSPAPEIREGNGDLQAEVIALRREVEIIRTEQEKVREAIGRLIEDLSSLLSRSS